MSSTFSAKLANVLVSIPEGAIEGPLGQQLHAHQLRFNTRRCDWRLLVFTHQKATQTVSIPEGAIEGTAKHLKWIKQLWVSIPEGAIEGGNQKAARNHYLLFQYPKVRLKASGATIRPTIPVVSIPEGAIEGWTPANCLCITKKFQYPKVRLKALIRQWIQPKFLLFQYPKVRLKGRALRFQIPGVFRFNTRRCDWRRRIS